jgi:hypothetical protein
MTSAGGGRDLPRLQKGRSVITNNCRQLRRQTSSVPKPKKPGFYSNGNTRGVAVEVLEQIGYEHRARWKTRYAQADDDLWGLFPFVRDAQASLVTKSTVTNMSGLQILKNTKANLSHPTISDKYNFDHSRVCAVYVFVHAGKKDQFGATRREQRRAESSRDNRASER